MSSVCSVGSASSSILMQQVQQPLQGKAPQQTTTEGAAPSAQRQSPLEAGALAAGIDPSVLTGLRSEIESAVKDALANSDGSTDRREVVRGAIDGVLQSHGIDASALRTQLEALRPAHGHRPHGAHGPRSGSAQGASSTAQESSLAEVLAGQNDADGDADGLNIASILQRLPAGSLVNIDG